MTAEKELPEIQQQENRNVGLGVFKSRQLLEVLQSILIICFSIKIFLDQSHN